jgi:hypothetical protein
MTGRTGSDASSDLQSLSPVKGVPLTAALDAFVDQFQAQTEAAGLPTSEHAVHFCLALGLQAAWDLAPGAILFERPAPDRSRTDLWVREPHDIAIEVKFLRPLPSGSSRPYPQLYGQVLADFNKIARVPATNRLMVLVADRDYVGYIERSGRGMMPMTVGSSVTIRASSLAQLSETAQRTARSHGEWSDLAITLIWSRLAGGCSLFTWEVAPCGPGTPILETV